MGRWTLAIAILLLWTGTACAQVGVTSLKGAPFSAEVVTQTDRVLQDGNHVRQTTHGKVFRDSEGRTRQETPFQRYGEENHYVSINDPVEQVFISFMMSGEKTASIHHMTPRSAAPPAQVDKSDAKPANSKASTEEEGPCPVLPPVDQLGTKVIEGVAVVGTRQTDTIPADKIGNEKPIVSVNDSWYSDELHEVVLWESDDPQYGHRTMKLVNIQRSEPDRALFQVPADYTVKDMN